MNMISTYVWPGSVHFGYGAVGLLGAEAKARGASHAFVVADPGVIAAGLLEPVAHSFRAACLSYTVYDRVKANPDTGSVDAAGQAARESQADLIVGLGGGSSLDTAKAVQLIAGGGGRIAEYALRLGDRARPAPRQLPPLIAIPTTAGTGSEVTPWAVVTEAAQKLKISVGGSFLMPAVALIDPELTLRLPPFLTAATGMDALSHCIEAYVSIRENSALDPMILHGIDLIGRSLRPAVGLGVRPPDEQAHRAARSEMALAAMIGGIAISSKWLGACHSLAHQLSGFANVHHGLANALMLPHQMAYSLSGALERYARIGQALGASANGSLQERAMRAVEAVRQLTLDVGLPTRLRDVGVLEEMILPMAENAYKQDTNWMTNPLPISQVVMEDLYREAL